jgi:hypothetical protein
MPAGRYNGLLAVLTVRALYAAFMVVLNTLLIDMAIIAE